jgi:hypothetical protein
MGCVMQLTPVVYSAELTLYDGYPLELIRVVR